MYRKKLNKNKAKLSSKIQQTQLYQVHIDVDCSVIESITSERNKNLI